VAELSAFDAAWPEVTVMPLRLGGWLVHAGSADESVDVAMWLGWVLVAASACYFPCCACRQANFDMPHPPPM